MHKLIVLNCVKKTPHVLVPSVIPHSEKKLELERSHPFPPRTAPGTCRQRPTPPVPQGSPRLKASPREDRTKPTHEQKLRLKLHEAKKSTLLWKTLHSEAI